MASKRNQIEHGIDTDLQSRALPVYGFDAMNRMRASDVLVIGSKGLGLEIAKNIILSGVKSVTVHDDEPVQIADLSSQFYATEADVGKARSAVNVEKLALLNQYVEVKSATGPITPEFLKNFKVVVSTNNNSLKRLIEMNEFCRSQPEVIRFIVADTFGLFGVVFCDFGKEFPVNDKDGEPLLSSIITSITNEKEPVVTVHEDKKHGLTDGDFVKFAEVRGMEELNFSKSATAYEIREIGPFSFKLLGVDSTNFGQYAGGGVATQVKVQIKLNFKSLAENLKEPNINTSDWGKIDRQHTLHVLYQALLTHRENGSNLPFTNEEIEQVLNIANGIKGGDDVKLELDIFKKIAKTSRGDLCPMAATIGGFASHEVLKACSSKFTPLQQFFYLDALECLPTDLLSDDEYAPTGSRYDGQIAVFGKTFQKKLGDLNYFLVGSGALGCEYLKNFAMMGLGCGPEGSVTVTDMDIIEKSNLSRQFLFRNTDIGQLKSTTAAHAAKIMNPSFNVHSRSIRVGTDTESTFTDSFWEKLDGVANALDNIQARQYVDTRCVFYKKPLMESGTLGTKGNVQVVKPHLTETYSDSRDPPEKTIPLCTLKNFPNTIDHTLQWARDTFEELFRQGPENVNDYIHKSDFLANLDKQGAGIVKLTLESVYRNLSEGPKNFEDCVKWARDLFQDYYHNTITQLLYNFPEDSVDKNGVRFWSGPKRAPKILDFDVNDTTHLDFIIAAANLRAQSYDIEPQRDVEYFKKVLSNVKVAPFQAKAGIKIQANENDNTAPPAQDEDEERLHFLKKNLPEPTSVSNFKMNPIEFEKDNDENFHIDFITAASNLRARNYRIDEADRHTSKVIAGKITPAIATTTTMITGLASIELYKVIQDKPLDHYKNAFVNLALPFVAFSDPIAPAKKKYYDTTFTVWDNFMISGNPTLAELIQHFKSNHKLSIEAITLPNGASFYRSFGMNKDTVAQRMKMKISDICTQFGKTTYYEGQKYQVLEILVEDEEGNDPDVPNVIVKLG